MYHYEMLDDQQFQKLCHALIISQHPDAQCLPVGQPDGGRDAFLLRRIGKFRRSEREQHDKELIIFQVKFKKNGSKITDATKEIDKIISTESKKVQNLLKYGPLSYYLITNIRGSAHLDNGSIDKINKSLSEKIGVPAICWWRDDLDARINANSSIKWSFPSILKATDILESLISGSLCEHQQRRKNALVAYMLTQFEEDKDLKFKQADLSATILNLFVDPPMELLSCPDAIRGSNGNSMVPSPPYLGLQEWRYYFGRPIRASDFLLNLSEEVNFGKIVIEGAPGQGKSTITQYISQILRMRFLTNRDGQSSLPKFVENSPLRIPFRVDLRDLARWFDGINPFAAEHERLAQNKQRTLESFIAEQVCALSGGHTFDVSDLNALTQASRILIALDGFDEVADVIRRQQMVDEIGKGVNRLVQIAPKDAVLVIVTSRPAAFSKSVCFPREQWAYFELPPLEKEQVIEYAQKWMGAKGLKPREQSELNRVLKEKLREPHTQYLAKNPMQLTILLTLMYNKGSSLPEKRTALYDSYIDMFFNREAEKSDIVRLNRDLLIDVHRYIAWQLQCDAEHGSDGSIDNDQLTKILKNYLSSQGEETGIVADLFNGIVERVGALVSRVAGTYEFEVQPLREYFAARHLYETAPYSPTGSEKPGTKLDRLNALLRNGYWLNVARFYAGCFSKGELSSLVAEIKELSRCQPFGETSLSEELALMLLGDWILSQYQPAVKEIVSFLFQSKKFRLFLSRDILSASGTSAWPDLHDRNGRSEVLDNLWDRFVKENRKDDEGILASLLKKFASIDELSQKWNGTREYLDETSWIKKGSLLDTLDAENSHQLSTVTTESISIILERGRFDLINKLGVDYPKDEIIFNNYTFSHLRIKDSSLEINRLSLFAHIFSCIQYIMALKGGSAMSLTEIEWHSGSLILEKIGADIKKINLSSDERSAVIAYTNFIQIQMSVTSTSIEPWVNLVEAFRKAWGDNPAIDRIAFLAAGVRSKDVATAPESLSASSDLVRAARSIRLKSGAPRWWSEILTSNISDSEKSRLLLLLWIWGTQKTIFKILPILDETLARLSDAEWKSLCRQYIVLRHAIPEKNNAFINDESMNSILLRGTRVKTFIGYKLGIVDQMKIVSSFISQSIIHNSPEVQFGMDTCVQSAAEAGNIVPYLEKISFFYNNGASPYIDVKPRWEINHDTAKMMIAKVDEYPLALLHQADNHLRSDHGNNSEKLGLIASRDDWFIL